MGKTTFINTLFSTTIKNYADHKRRHAKQIDKTVEIEITKAELEEKFFKVRLTVIDTPGFGDYVNNRDSWMPIIEFLDDQHESYMLQEQQPKRQDKIDLRVHTCLYFIRPTGHTLKPLDIEVMKRLCSRVNLIPVIAKADTLSPSDLAKFKARVSTCVITRSIELNSSHRYAPSSTPKESRSTSLQLKKTTKPPPSTRVISSEPCPSLSSVPRKTSRLATVALSRAVSTTGV